MAKQALIILFTVLAFGILVPWYKGFTFLDPRMLAAYGLLAVLFVAPASAESFAGERDLASPGAILARLMVLIAFGWGITVLVLLTALATLNLSYWHGTLIAPPGQLFAAVILCSLTACAAVGTLGALLARTFSARMVKTILRFGFLLILLAFVGSSRHHASGVGNFGGMCAAGRAAVDPSTEKIRQSARVIHDLRRLEIIGSGT
jgi:hypothetical protein